MKKTLGLPMIAFVLCGLVSAVLSPRPAHAGFDEDIASAREEIQKNIQDSLPQSAQKRQAWCAQERRKAGENAAEVDALHAAGKITDGERDMLERMHAHSLEMVNTTCEAMTGAKQEGGGPPAAALAEKPGQESMLPADFKEAEQAFEKAPAAIVSFNGGLSYNLVAEVWGGSKTKSKSAGRIEFRTTWYSKRQYVGASWELQPAKTGWFGVGGDRQKYGGKCPAFYNPRTLTFTYVLENDESMFDWKWDYECKQLRPRHEVHALSESLICKVAYEIWGSDKAYSYQFFLGVK